MNKTLLSALLLAPFSAFAYPSPGEIQAAYAEQNRACMQPGANRYGSQASRECVAAGRAVQELNRSFVNEANQEMARKAQDRQRIQEEEMWREQVRRGYRY